MARDGRGMGDGQRARRNPEEDPRVMFLPSTLDSFLEEMAGGGLPSETATLVIQFLSRREGCPKVRGSANLTLCWRAGDADVMREDTLQY